MLVKFKKLFHLQFNHEYFNAGGSMNIFELQLKTNIPNTGIKQDPDGYFVYCQASENDDLDPQELTILINIKDAGFYNYTNLNFSSTESLLLDSSKSNSGVFEISNNDYAAVPEGHSLNPVPAIIFNWKKDDEHQNSTFTFSFTSRKTIWRYIFMNLEEEKWSDINIDKQDWKNQELTFTKKSEEQKKHMLVSNISLPLLEHPKIKIMVNSTGPAGGMLLPYPDPQNLALNNTEKENDREAVFYSDMYIYL